MKVKTGSETRIFPNIINNATTDYTIAGGSDSLITDPTNTTVSDSGTRTRWNGVIGGGPLDGVNLSTTTGQFDGDLAVADGTSIALAGAWAHWDAGNSQWQFVDPTGTV